MNVLSLFDGMSCGQIALNRAGVKVDNYFASEIDKHAIKVTQKNYPNTKQLGDVRNIKALDLPKIDLLIGGSPCQSFSFAGNQKGMSTTENIKITALSQYLDLKNKGFEFEGQSYLFWEYVYILRTLKPKYFLLENVLMSKEWEIILSKEVGIEPIYINSELVSAQSRKRLYWTNIGAVPGMFGDLQPGIQPPKDKKINLNSILENAVSEKKKSYCIGALYGKGSNLKRYLHRGSRQMVFTDAEFMRDITVNKPKEEDSNKIGKENRDKWRVLTPIECERLQTVPDNYTEGASNYWRYHMIGNGWTVDVIAHIFNYLP